MPLKDSRIEKPKHEPAHDPAHDAVHDAVKSAPPQPESKVLMEGMGRASPIVRFTLNGTVKSLARPVSGADLYRIAGGPQKLTAGGRTIANDTEPIDIADGAELKASY